jgi:ADP-ribose pyrophosphatase YjhB (NUDIX family)
VSFWRLAKETIMQPNWLDWAQRLQAIAQTGIHYDPPPFDRERYEAVREVAAEIIAAHNGGDMAAVRALFEMQTGHATPKVDVRGVIFRHDALLLVREYLDGGRWTVPGGWVDVTEAPREAVEREVYEETGYRVQAVKLLAVFDRRLHGHPPALFHAYKLFIRCELLADQPDAAYAAEGSASYAETGEARFFRQADIPYDELSTGRITASQISRFFEHLRQPDLPTDFD